MSAPVTKRHRELAYERFGQKPPMPVERNWLETGEDPDGYFYLSMPKRAAQWLADIEASALAAAPLAPTGRGEREHLEEAARLLASWAGQRFDGVEQKENEQGVIGSRLAKWLEAERARKAGK